MVDLVEKSHNYLPLPHKSITQVIIRNFLTQADKREREDWKKEPRQRRGSLPDISGYSWVNGESRVDRS